MPVYGEKPRPRALLLGFDETEARRVEGLFPTLRTITSLDEVRQEEWDLLITRKPVQAENHLFLLCLGIERFGTIKLPDKADARLQHIVCVSGSSLATEFVVPDSLDPQIARLVQIALLPIVIARAKNDTLGVRQSFSDGSTVKHESLNFYEFTPFLNTTEGMHLAGSFKRQDSKSEAWCLPSANLDILPWATVALRRWHQIAPDRFPVNPGWEHQQNWMVQTELIIARELEALRKQRIAVLAQFEAKERELESQLHDAQNKADNQERLLLTAQDERLAGVVMAVLREFGFEVEDMDRVFPKNDRREDLRVRSPEAPSWVAICEIKGYHKGAKVGDLLKMERFKSRFYQECGRNPDRCWYVVNHFIKDEPSTRGVPLGMNSEEVETFSEDGGLVIGTVELFQLLSDIRSGRIEPAMARQILRGKTGVLAMVEEERSKPPE